MENNIENKAKLFAQYWGQEVVKWEFLTGESSSMTLPVDDIRINDIKKFHLKLKPLSSITDEDAIESDKFLGWRMSNGQFKKDLSIRGKDWDLQKFPSILIDYLRSKGYALPYMGLSIEKQIEYGWIKLVL